MRVSVGVVMKQRMLSRLKIILGSRYVNLEGLSKRMETLLIISFYLLVIFIFTRPEI